MGKNLPIFLFAFILVPADSIAQKNLKNNLHVFFARSFHGTGDLSGLDFTGEYGHFFTNRLEISGNITSTIHWGSFGLFVSSPNGNFDGSLRFVTAGLQAGSKLGFAFLNFPKHMLKVQGGSFIRYQSSSNPGQYAVTYPPAINYPEPVFTFRNQEKQNILTIGYVGEISYTYLTPKKLMFGVKAGFQNDSNADVISYYGVLVGKRLN